MFVVVVVDGLATYDVFGGYFSMGLSSPGVDYSIGIVPTFGVVEEDPFLTSTSLGNQWIWDFENLDPTLDDDLEIECQPAIQSHAQQTIGEWTEGHPSHLYADYIERRDEWSMLHSNYIVKASSTLRPDGDIRYDPENIRDRRGKNAWSEGADGPGIDEWLEITPVEPKPLLAIHIKPGYQKGDLFRANARPKTIRIELNGEHHFDAAIPDREEEVEIPVSGYAKPVKKNYRKPQRTSRRFGTSRNTYAAGMSGTMFQSR